jgi:hypothetical protein
MAPGRLCKTDLILGAAPYSQAGGMPNASLPYGIAPTSGQPYSTSGGSVQGFPATPLYPAVPGFPGQLVDTPSATNPFPQESSIGQPGVSYPYPAAVDTPSASNPYPMPGYPPSSGAPSAGYPPSSFPATNPSFPATNPSFPAPQPGFPAHGSSFPDGPAYPYPPADTVSGQAPYGGIPNPRGNAGGWNL